jgi:hypothetical protein
MKTRTAIDAILFRAYASLGEKAAASRCFRRCYSSVKEVCSNLPTTDHVEDYVSNREFVAIVERFRTLEAKTQASD